MANVPKDEMQYKLSLKTTSANVLIGKRIDDMNWLLTATMRIPIGQYVQSLNTKQDNAETWKIRQDNKQKCRIRENMKLDIRTKSMTRTHEDMTCKTWKEGIHVDTNSFTLSIYIISHNILMCAH